MKCDEEGCYEAAIISILKDLFGKSDAMRNLCSKHAPRWLAVSASSVPDAQGPSPLDVALAEVDRRKAQLWKYGKHRATCALWASMANPCTCGWVKVRETLAPAQQSSDDAINAAIAPTARETEGDANG